MIEFTISPARSLDAGAVGNILSVSNDLMPWLPRVHSAAEEIKYAGDMIEAGWVKVAKIDNKVVGFIARHESEVYALYVLPEAQDKGIGTALLEDAKGECDKLGLWSYEANGVAAIFYELRGFVSVDRTNGSGNEAGLPDIRFEWTRNAPEFKPARGARKTG
ncbi:N-acetyltransferase [Roseobacter denitrificans]|uniref:Acetyltransferase, putative n=1 Tax=Roseobacter denitrificans (strain ATCC 33942 / OCh 114) TaxID=375451 RepID=Q168B9_ROSDO|nr:GNAT family N-acetyltransferase [Roseobacter denitrificans]ABG31674.1 acetyltransferase, putative [Roseobacter denitrificans OCh 114]AVL51275.1 N-acetyltransferase [Roseobacter denitrificans]SFF88498.1 Acetyltransferase (GNAT) domain-containing protein [Roseobacter denitrificans OCh 114]